jgi:GT2 family glycosyltransferase
MSGAMDKRGVSGGEDFSTNLEPGRRPGRLAVLKDFVGRTLHARPPGGGASAGDKAVGTASEPGLDLPLGPGRLLPPGHYRVTVPIVSGAETLRAPILEVLSVYTARNRAVRLDRVPRRSGLSLGCDIALTSVASALRLVPGSVDGEVICGPVRLRRLTRMEFYGRLVGRVLSRQRREGVSTYAVVGNMAEVLRTRGLRGLAADLRRTGNLSPEAAYQRWIEIRERLDHVREVYRQRLKRAAEGLPLMSLIAVAGDTKPGRLSETIASLRDQVYERWELLVTMHAETPAPLVDFIRAAAAGDSRVRIVEVEAGCDPAVARNAALAGAAGDWIAVLPTADTLSPVALAAVAFDAAAHPDARLYYADDDHIGPSGQRSRPRFKPEFSRELLRSTDYMGGLLFVRTAALRESGGWRTSFGEAMDYDLALRVFEGWGAASIRHLGQVLHHRRARLLGANKPRAMRRALEDHLERTGVPARVEELAGIDGLRLRHAVPRPSPMVSLIVPTRDKVELLRGCVESVLSLTSYDNYEILVADNGSSDPAALDYLAMLRKRDRIRVLSCDEPFNYSRINNLAVDQAKGTVIGLLNNDTVVITPDWLSEMVSWAMQADVGCVGAKLLYGDDSIQHAGVIIGVGDVAGHAHRHFPRDHDGYCHRLKLVQNLSAVTAACLVVRRSVYEEVGGLNERDLTVAYNDVDFCLRVRAAGYLNVWTPFAELYHLESLTRGSDRSSEKARRYADEVAYMHQHWDLRSDPYYSPHLTRLREDFSIAV